jgi:hypothetical protein
LRVQLLRSSLATSIFVKRQADGADMDTIEAFCNEQQTAKANFPGPGNHHQYIRDSAPACMETSVAVSLRWLKKKKSHGMESNTWARSSTMLCTSPDSSIIGSIFRSGYISMLMFET